MPRNIGYPGKTRDVTVGKLYPPKSRSLAPNQTTAKVDKPTQHGAPKDGKPPKKGVLTSGGGHG